MDTHFIGLDVHKSSTTVAVLSGDGKLVQRSTVLTDPKTLRGMLSAIPGPTAAAMEAGTMSAWLSARLGSSVDELIVCHPSANRAAFRGDKSDERDALRLAQLLRLGELQPAHHATPPYHALRVAAGTYDQLTADSVRCRNRLHALYRSQGFGQASKKGAEAEGRRFRRKADRERHEVLVRQLAFLGEERDRARAALVREAGAFASYARLQTLPGFGPIHAAMWLAIVGDPHRFPNKRALWRFAGLAVVKRTSGDWENSAEGLRRRSRERTFGLNRDHHPRLKLVFMQAALQASRMECVQQYQKAYVDRGMSPGLIRVVTARKLAAVALALAKQGGRFDPNRLRHDGNHEDGGDAG